MNNKCTQVEVIALRILRNSNGFCFNRQSQKSKMCTFLEG